MLPKTAWQVFLRWTPTTIWTSYKSCTWPATVSVITVCLWWTATGDWRCYIWLTTKSTLSMIGRVDGIISESHSINWLRNRKMLITKYNLLLFTFLGTSEIWSCFMRWTYLVMNWPHYLSHSAIFPNWPHCGLTPTRYRIFPSSNMPSH